MTDEPDPEWMAEYADYMRQQEETELIEAWELIEWNEQKQRKPQQSQR